MEGAVVTLGPDIFKGAPNLGRLYVTGRGSVVLEPGVFNGLDALDELSVQAVGPATPFPLPEDAFEHLTSLRRLFLANPATLTSRMAWDLRGVKDLLIELRGVPLPNDFFRILSNVESLYLGTDVNDRGLPPLVLPDPGFSKLERVKSITLDNVLTRPNLFQGAGPRTLEAVSIDMRKETSLPIGIFQGMRSNLKSIGVRIRTGLKVPPGFFRGASAAEISVGNDNAGVQVNGDIHVTETVSDPAESVALRDATSKHDGDRSSIVAACRSFGGNPRPLAARTHSCQPGSDQDGFPITTCTVTSSLRCDAGL